MEMEVRVLAQCFSLRPVGCFLAVRSYEYIVATASQYLETAFLLLVR